jgi:hypothetical protein
VRARTRLVGCKVACAGGHALGKPHNRRDRRRIGMRQRRNEPLVRTSFMTPIRDHRCPGKEIGRPIEGGLQCFCQTESTHVRYPLLSLRFCRGSRLCRKLEHRSFLILKQIG